MIINYPALALFSMAFFGLGPVGNLAVGWAGRHFGAQLTLLVCALATFVVALGALRTKARIDFSLPVLGG